MRPLSALRDALEKLDAAETALMVARNAYRSVRLDLQPNYYQRLDEQFEVIGDAATNVRDILHHEEIKTLSEAKS
jgi:hypothetical protein